MSSKRKRSRTHNTSYPAPGLRIIMRFDDDVRRSPECIPKNNNITIIVFIITAIVNIIINIIIIIIIIKIVT